MRRLLITLAGVLGLVALLAPTANAATAKSLHVTWEQQSTEYNCGPTATRIALSGLVSSPPSQGTLASYMGTDENGTDDISDVTGALNHYAGTGWYESKYIDSTPTSAQAALLKRDLVYDVDRGYPMVANVVSGWRPPFYPSGTIYHYVAVVGYEDSGATAVIADPAGRSHPSSGTGTWDDVPSTYRVSTSDLATWIGSKGYAA